MKTKFSLALVLLALAIAAGGAIAQEFQPASPEAALGTAFTYQGYLAEGNSPAEGPYDFRFALYDAAEGGNQVGDTFLIEDTPVTQGRFAVQLDFGASAFAGQARWLEVAVRPGSSTENYTSLSPRQALTASPYALHSRNADLLDGQHASAFADAAHNHLGEEWLGISTTLVISGTFSEAAPLALYNDAVLGDGLRIQYAHDDGLQVDSAGGAGVYVASAGYDGVQVDSAGDNGVEVNSSTSDGVYVYSAGGDGVRVGSAENDGMYVYVAAQDGVNVRQAGNPSSMVSSTANNGFEVEGAQGNGLYIGRADSSGAYVNSATTGYWANSVGYAGLYVESASMYGVYVTSAGFDGVFANTARTSGEWGFNTPDKIYASNVTLRSLTLIAQVAESATLSPGDLVAAVGVAEPAPGSAIPQPLVTLADQTSFPGALGVVQSCLAYTPTPLPEGVSGEAPLELHSVDGSCQPGSLVALTVFGVASVRVDPAVEIQPGMRLTASAIAGAARPLRNESLNGMTVAEGAPVIGIALAAPAADSNTIPIFVTLR